MALCVQVVQPQLASKDSATRFVSGFTSCIDRQVGQSEVERKVEKTTFFFKGKKPTDVWIKPRSDRWVVRSSLQVKDQERRMLSELLFTHQPPGGTCMCVCFCVLLEIWVAGSPAMNYSAAPTTTRRCGDKTPRCRGTRHDIISRNALTPPPPPLPPPPLPPPPPPAVISFSPPLRIPRVKAPLLGGGRRR